MKRLSVLLSSLVFVFVFMSMCQNAFAWVDVPDYGDTGWHTYSHTFNSDWTGAAGFLVSNYGDGQGDTYSSPLLLIDNLKATDSSGASLNAFANPSFETGDLYGYGSYGDVGVETYDNAFDPNTNSWDGTEYLPTDGSYMAYLCADDTNADIQSWLGSSAGILSESTNGAIMYLDNPDTNGLLSFDAGDTFSFDWAFIGDDYYPYQDFSLFIHTLGDDQESIGYDELGRIGNGCSNSPVPEPPSVMLLVIGFAVLLYRTRRMLILN